MLAVEDTLLVFRHESLEGGVVIAKLLQVVIDREAHGEHTVDDIDIAVVGLDHTLNGVVVYLQAAAAAIDPDGLPGAVVDTEAVAQLGGRDGDVADAVVGKDLTVGDGGPVEGAVVADHEGILFVKGSDLVGPGLLEELRDLREVAVAAEVGDNVALIDLSGGRCDGGLVVVVVPVGTRG